MKKKVSFIHSVLLKHAFFKCPDCHCSSVPRTPYLGKKGGREEEEEEEEEKEEEMVENE